ncbi:protein CREG1 isoform X1 [Trichoplusia ni]|uniref:Protein CREG1 isoform X1 n=2 Tax=Trichoplusia ni TaxID=7111 RepID=A0A7E5WU61_TRINI|nr:protein CREG1 isoform X1 [Trichoplusia ni]
MFSHARTMKWQGILFACLCLLTYAECRWKHEKHGYRDNANEMTTKPNHRPDPPDHTKLIPMARYVLHNADWASLATISILPAIEGFPFSNVKSIVDGSMANSTGVPYFYMSPLDFSARDLTKNSRATVLVSLEETRYCETHQMDPEDPRCTRLMLSGKMKKLKVNTPEYNFAKAALFERHPAMADFPPDHDWFVAKLKIALIAMVDWYGGAKYIPVRDYLAYNYTGTEMLQYHNKNNLQRTVLP